jgi:hypothetical protein
MRGEYIDTLALARLFEVGPPASLREVPSPRRIAL